MHLTHIFALDLSRGKSIFIFCYRMLENAIFISANSISDKKRAIFGGAKTCFQNIVG